MRIVLAVLIVFLSTFAIAHDHSRPDLDSWFKGLQSQGKMPCCDGSDATSLQDPDWKFEDGHYVVRLEGKWVVVPDAALVTVPNKFGPALVWPYYKDGMPIVRCFMPGTMA